MVSNPRFQTLSLHRKCPILHHVINHKSLTSIQSLEFQFILVFICDGSRIFGSEHGNAILQEALGGEDVELIKEKTSALSQASMKIGEAMNKAR